MSWNSKVVWSEGLFLRPQHLQQSDRYLERAIDLRTRYISPYPWGFAHLEIDRDLQQQSRFGLRRAAGILPDGTTFDVPTDSPLPLPVDIPPDCAGKLVWLAMPAQANNSREIDENGSDSAARFVIGSEAVIDSASHLRTEEAIAVAYPRLGFDVGAAKAGFVSLPVARIIEVSDRAIVFDEKYCPPILSCAVHPVPMGWLERLIGIVLNKIEQLSRYAADPRAGGAMQDSDYFTLQVLNRTLPVLNHFRQSRFVHPERLFEEMLRLAGEMSTFGSQSRRGQDYPAYDHDNLEAVFNPVIDDIQFFLAKSQDRKAFPLNVINFAPGAYRALVTDRTIFRDATLILDVTANLSPDEIQRKVPRIVKVGPDGMMAEIVNSNLEGIPLRHLPTPPRYIRPLTDHVYFRLDSKGPLWPEFIRSDTIGIHFADDWPELAIDLWAVREGTG